ncbi:hypothetical protein K1S38_16905, partial [Klebsiella pneumoniae]|nr:hypothetical protein [Klebsiella pneumoniae]
MTQYNTGNPVPSSAMPDIWDNNATIDEFVNSPELTLTTRTGTERDTLAGIQKKSDDQRVQMAEDGAAVVEETRQNLIPLSRQYMTLAAAQADIANIPQGSTTYYRSPDDSALAIEVINNSGTLEPTGRKMPSQQAVDDIAEQTQQVADDLAPMKGTIKFDDIGDLVAAIVDVVGFIGWQIDKNGGFGSGTAYISPDKLKISELQISQTNDALIRLTDPNGLFWDMVTK